MDNYLKNYSSLTAEDRKKVLAAAQWGNGPFTRIIFREHFPKITNDEIENLIHQIIAAKDIH